MCPNNILIISKGCEFERIGYQSNYSACDNYKESTSVSRACKALSNQIWKRSGLQGQSKGDVEMWSASYAQCSLKKDENRKSSKQRWFWYQGICSSFKRVRVLKRERVLSDRMDTTIINCETMVTLNWKPSTTGHYVHSILQHWKQMLVKMAVKSEWENDVIHKSHFGRFL